MSAKPSLSDSRFQVASRTSFQYLDVESGEEEEEVNQVNQNTDVATDVLPNNDNPPELITVKASTRASSKRASKKAATAGPLKSTSEQKEEPSVSVADAELPTPIPQPDHSSIRTANGSGEPFPAENATSPPVAKRVTPHNRSSSRSRPPPALADPSFHPSLPDSLPTPPATKFIRKRKASADLTTNPLTKESKVEFIRENGDEVSVTSVPVTVTVSSSTDGPAAQKERSEREKKKANALIRTFWSLVMIGGFVTLLSLGPSYVIVLVLVCQTLVYREVTALFGLSQTPVAPSPGANKGKDPWSKTLNWYFFAVTNYFLYGESIIYYFKHVIFADVMFLPFAMNHRFISFMLYMFGFMGFVVSLQKHYLRRQFGLFCWVHMTLLVIVVSSHFIVNNILEGMIWFWVPASLVICNDCFAYIWGVTMGRTPLFKLSPKKTVEGFVGAFISTMIFGVIWGTIFMRYNYMICPIRDLGTSAWTAQTCTPNPVFVWREYTLPAPLRLLISSLFSRSITKIPYAPYQFHLLVMSTFASLVAPFGGFFASGFKRAFDLKDFGQSIPGHGGMTDRMDCQFLMGMFSYVYYSSLIRVHAVTVGSLLQTIVSSLTLEEQLELLGDLKRYLEGRGQVL